MKLSLEERQALYELTQEPGFPVLMKAMDSVIAENARIVLDSPVHNRLEAEHLSYLKSFHDGARSLRDNLARFLKSLTQKEN